MNLPNLEKFDPFLRETFKYKAPSLPQDFKEKTVTYAPLILILESLLALSSVLTFFGLGTPFLNPYYGYSLQVQGGIFYLLRLVVLVFTRTLRLIAVKPLINRDKKGWRLVYLSIFANTIYDFLAFDFFGLIMVALLSFYLLYQIEDFYS